MTSLTLVRRIAARPAIVFAALTSAEGIAAWWGPDEGPVLMAEVEPRVGGQCRVRFRMRDGTEHESAGEYLEFDPPARLVMSFRWIDGGEREENGATSRITIDLRPIESGTELTFTHDRLQNEPSRASHHEGWSGSLDKLVRHFAQAVETDDEA